MSGGISSKNHRRLRWVLLGPLLLIADVVVINAAFLLSFWLRFHSGWVPVFRGIPPLGDYIHVLPVLTVIIILLMNSYRLYMPRSRLSIIDDAFSILKVTSMGLLVFMAASFVYREFSYSRGLLLIAWAVLTAALISARFLINRLRLFLRARRRTLRNLLVVGTGHLAGRLISQISKDPHWDYNVCGVLSASSVPSGGAIGGVPVLGGFNDLANVLERHDIGEIILTDPSLERGKIMNIILECEKRLVEFRLIADMLGMVTSSVDMQNIDGFPLLSLKESPLNEWYNRGVKRAVDIAGALCGLLILSPVFAVIAAAVKSDSNGPVLYLQKRIGEDGRRFTMLKFRTMIEDAEKHNGIGWTRPDDPRRTKAGAFLRGWNLDELPQLVNVLRGDMSLVGPRPERPHYVNEFKDSIPRYMARHKIKSGMTGWAQVNGLRGDTSIEERTKYDLYYLENWSLLFDLKILFMSLFTLRRGY